MITEHPRRMFKKAAQRGRSKRRGEAYSFPYVEPLSGARTKLEAFFNILLAVADRLRKNGSVLMKTTDTQTNPDLDEPARPSAERRPASGILVFTTSLQVLHRNPQALELSRRISQAETGTTSSGMFPKAVTDLCHEVRRGLQIRIDAEDWAQFQVQRLIGEGHKPVVLQGIGVPDRGGLTRSRILIVMKEAGREEGVSNLSPRV